MTTTVRVACPSGAGVRIKHGTQVAEVPAGGVHTFYLYQGVQASAEITELGSLLAPIPVNPLAAENDCLKAEVAHLKEQLAEVAHAVQDA